MQHGFRFGTVRVLVFVHLRGEEFVQGVVDSLTLKMLFDLVKVVVLREVERSGVFGATTVYCGLGSFGSTSIILRLLQLPHYVIPEYFIVQQHLILNRCVLFHNRSQISPFQLFLIFYLEYIIHFRCRNEPIPLSIDLFDPAHYFSHSVSASDNPDQLFFLSHWLQFLFRLLSVELARVPRLINRHVFQIVIV